MWLCAEAAERKHQTQNTLYYQNTLIFFMLDHMVHIITTLLEIVNGANGVNTDRSPKERSHSAPRAQVCQIVAGRIQDAGPPNVL